MAAFDRTRTMAPPLLCAKCGCDDESMIEIVEEGRQLPPSNLQLPKTSAQVGSRESAVGSFRKYYCNICSHEWTVPLRAAGRFHSIEDVVQRTGLRRDELTTLADIGALNAFTNERRSALWQVERAVRTAGSVSVSCTSTAYARRQGKPWRLSIGPGRWRLRCCAPSVAATTSR